MRKRLNKTNNTFRNFATKTSNAAGSPWAFALAISIVLVWACFGPYYRWSSQHSLFINSATTIVTFLMVFLVQASQNRDSRAIQVKLNALLAASTRASNKLIDLESAAEEELEEAVKEIKSFKDAEE